VSRLKHDAESLGAKILIFDRPAREVLPAVADSFGADAVYCSSLPAFDEAREERELAVALGVRLQADPQSTLLDRTALPFTIGQLPEVFTQFRNQVEERLTVRAEVHTPKALPSAGSWTSPILSWDFGAEGPLPHQEAGHPHFSPGEAAGLARLETYLWKSDRIQTYKQTRNGLIDWDDSSKLSPYLSVGALSPRRVYFELKRYEHERVRNDSTYWLLFELLWRDYFKLIAEKWGAKLFTGMKPRSEPRHDASAFASWCRGETGDRFVDANMRELNATGWMSNRGRQNVASYLAKTMRLDWRQGASYFEERLIDYDPTSNWGNWAYLAGVGQDGRDRVFNPEKQASLYDPAGTYRDRWSPRK
jgi:deoxyribodipyrimidine photo-lyase